MRHFFVSVRFDNRWWMGWSGTMLTINAKRLAIWFLCIPLARIALRDIELVSAARLGPWPAVCLRYRKRGGPHTVTLSAFFLIKRIVPELFKYGVPIADDR